MLIHIGEMLHRFSGVISLSAYRRSSKKKDALQLQLPEFPIDGERKGSNPRQAVAHLSHVGERVSLHLLVFLHKGAVRLLLRRVSDSTRSHGRPGGCRVRAARQSCERDDGRGNESDIPTGGPEGSMVVGC